MPESRATDTGSVAVLGRVDELRGYRMAGAVLLAGEDDSQVRASWAALDPGIGLVVLTADAAAALGDLRSRPGAPLTAVIPG